MLMVQYEIYSAKEILKLLFWKKSKNIIIISKYPLIVCKSFPIGTFKNSIFTEKVIDGDGVLDNSLILEYVFKSNLKYLNSFGFTNKSLGIN